MRKIKDNGRTLKYISEKILLCEICKIEGIETGCESCGGYSDKSFKLLIKYAKRYKKRMYNDEQTRGLIESNDLIREMRAFCKDVAENYDCDLDGHKNNTGCRSCNAKAIIEKTNSCMANDNPYYNRDFRETLPSRLSRFIKRIKSWLFC